MELATHQAGLPLTLVLFDQIQFSTFVQIFAAVEVRASGIWICGSYSRHLKMNRTSSNSLVTFVLSRARAVSSTCAAGAFIRLLASCYMLHGSESNYLTGNIVWRDLPVSIF